MNAVPANWSRLREAERAGLEKTLARLKFEAELAEGAEQSGLSTLTGAVSGSAEYLAQVLVIAGAEKARAACFLADETLPALLSHGEEPVREAAADAVGALSYVAVTRCLGVRLPDSADGVEARWLRAAAGERRHLNDYNIRTAALAAVAAGEVDLVPRFDGGGALKPRTTARRIEGANVAGFTRHLAEVVKGGGGPDAVEDPWRSFLRMFPITLAAKGADWVDLVWAAMAMMVQFEKRPASDVGTWLPGLVAELE